jgi:hypothetical protein
MSHLLGNLPPLDACVPGKDGVVGNTTNGDCLAVLHIDLDGATGVAEAAKRQVC